MNGLYLLFQERKRQPFAAARFGGKFFKGAGLFGLDGGIWGKACEFVLRG